MRYLKLLFNNLPLSKEWNLWWNIYTFYFSWAARCQFLIKIIIIHEYQIIKSINIVQKFQFVNINIPGFLPLHLCREFSLLFGYFRFKICYESENLMKVFIQWTHSKVKLITILWGDKSHAVVWTTRQGPYLWEFFSSFTHINHTSLTNLQRNDAWCHLLFIIFISSNLIKRWI